MRDRDLKPRTRALYRGILDRHILPALRERPVKGITPTIVRAWYAGLDPTHPTGRAHAYSLLKTILAAAVADEIIPTNPARITGAGTARKRRQLRPLDAAELHKVAAAMPEKYRAAVLLAGWCALRSGELLELRRPDVDLDALTIRVRRAVTFATGTGAIVGTPKSEAGARDVSIPPHIKDTLADHLDRFAAPGPSGLLFHAAGDHRKHLSPTTLHKPFAAAREAIGRPTLRMHDLRHSGAVLAALSGATVRELMDRLGHTTPTMAMAYQHVAEGRDAEIARRLSALAGGEPQ